MKKIIKWLILEPLEMILAMCIGFSPLIIFIGVTILIWSLIEASVMGIIIGGVLCGLGVGLLSLWKDVVDL